MIGHIGYKSTAIQNAKFRLHLDIKINNLNTIMSDHQEYLYV